MTLEPGQYQAYLPCAYCGCFVIEVTDEWPGEPALCDACWQLGELYRQRIQTHSDRLVSLAEAEWHKACQRATHQKE